MDIIRTLATSVLFAIVLAQEDNSTVKRAGMLGNSVKLLCRIPVSQTSPKVRWEDMVHTSSRGPILIFESQNNPSFNISADHPNKVNYRVDKKNFDLKISNLTFDDAGAYTCLSEQGQNVQRQDYYLLIYGHFGCTGVEKQLSESESLTLVCEVGYSGGQPSLKWYLEDVAMESKDLSGFTDTYVRAAKELELNASHELDGKTLRCKMELGDKNTECERVLNVRYPVRDIGFANGDRNEFYVGEELTCIARGNPAPQISLLPTSLPEEVENRKKSSIIIPSNWVGKDVTLECTAKNTYEGREEVIRKTKTIHILEATTTTTTTTPTTTTTTMKPKTERPKPAVDNSGSSGEGLFSSRKGYPLILLSVTLMKLLVF